MNHNLFRMRLLSTIRIRSEIRSGFDPKFDMDPIQKSGYPEGPNPDPDSKMLDPSNSDPDILIFLSGYPDP